MFRVSIVNHKFLMDDTKALEALFNAGWVTSAQLGEWKGVKVNGAGRVIELYLNWNKLKG
jgi:hypothetical protein